MTPSTGNVRKMLFGVGSDRSDHRRRRSRMPVTSVKSGLRWMSTTLSLHNAGSKHKTNRVKSAVIVPPKPRHQRPATGIIEWTDVSLTSFDIE